MPWQTKSWARALAGPDQSALELGCGPGHLSLALAKKGIRVTALDRSSGMIRTVQARAGQTGLAIKTLCRDWKKMPPEPGGHHLAIAACLPEAFSPSGICRMEGLAGRSCLLVMGRGSEVFPLRRQIWDQVMDQPCQCERVSPGMRGKLAGCRRPKAQALYHQPACDTGHQLPDAMDFYTAYFSMFRPRSRTGAKDPVLARAIQQVLAPFETHGRVRARGNADLAMIAWQKGTREKQAMTRIFKRFKRWAGRALYLMMVLWGISLVTFSFFALAPGDPAEIILRDRTEAPRPEQILALRQELGLDDPWPIQYLGWISRVIRLDLGKSWQTGRPVCLEILERLRATGELALAAFGLTILISSVCGSLSAVFRGRAGDRMFQTLMVGVTAMPAFWLGTVLIYLFALKWPLLPVAGRGGPTHLMLPALTLALGLAFVQANILRAELIRLFSCDPIHFARAKGLGWGMIFWRHILPAVLAPMVNLWGVTLGQLLGGAVIVESVFAWPGIGRLLVTSVMARDIPCAQGIVLFTAVIFVMVNALADHVHHRLDPRLKRRRP